MPKQADTSQELFQKNRRLGLIISAIVLAMIGLSFASVPLYNLFCKVTGFGGETQVSASFPKEQDIVDRTITVKFNADKGRYIPWSFYPEKRAIDLKIGDRGLISYVAQNTSSKPSAGTAIYNVSPAKAGKYFHKVQCFCFDEQILAGQQKVNMPVMFYIDPKLHEDPAMDDIHVITLSYTFYKAESEELDRALNDFYNGESNDT